MRSFIKQVALVLGLLVVGSGLFSGVTAASPYGGLQNEANQKPVLPRAVVLVQQGHAIPFSPMKLGWQLDSRKIGVAAGRKGLPVDNKLAVKTGRPWPVLAPMPEPDFFSKQVIPAYTMLNQAALTRQITALAAMTQQPAVDARIITQNGNYDLSPAAPGSRIDIPKAVAAVKLALASNKAIVTLPVAALPPAVTEASLQPQLQQLKAQQAATLAAARAAKPVVPHSCADNPAGRQLILVSISQQHLWACSGPAQAYDTAITSGAYLAGDATPTGTWHIYSKSTNIHLTGPTWDDFVSYWMPFYSDYGFHDSSWQTFPYGSSQYASDGSHGCVHLPAAAMAWLYGWAPIGTTVTITG